MTTRRRFLGSSLAAAWSTTWHPRTTELIKRGILAPPPRRNTGIGEPDLKALAHRALDAALAAGASYADVRFTVTQQRDFVADNQPHESKAVAVGVRALAQGAWGFAADTELTADMAAWLGTTAAKLGKVSAWPNAPRVELGERPPAAVGAWQMPVKRDPLTVSDAEYLEVFQALRGAASAQGAQLIYQFNMGRQERTFASTEGAFATQTIYRTFNETRDNQSGLLIIVPTGQNSSVSFSPPDVSPNGYGFEVFEEQKFSERVPEWIEEAKASASARPLDGPGRYEVVFDGHAMAALINTLGAALEADRAMGYQANDVGTSYLAPIEQMLGTTPLPPTVTIAANRSRVGEAATVKWDDEGIAPQDYTLIKDGKLIDYATSREFMPAMAAWYRTQGQPMQSRGCAAAEDALMPPLVRTPNLRLHPGPQDTSFESLLAGIDHGFAIKGGEVRPDQQQLTLIGNGTTVYEVKQGRLAGQVSDVRYLARMPELWKSLVALGGERSAVTRGFTTQKGAPHQSSAHSVRAVAARFRNVTLIDARR